ncbi:MAG: glycosyltransferase family 2 protein [Candidatus Hydrothermarchaeota archaeon]|nr:glycosyltransferase family 2 protein [Candidatus Hydrothermarchaeota archaeon]
MKLAAVIPVYNGEKTIRQVVKAAEKFVDKVIVVDDGSTDESAAEAKKTSAEVIVLQKNRGKAHALKTAFRRCKGYDVIIMLDGDAQHPPEEIPSLIKCIESGNDLCIGSRFYSDCRSMPFASKFSNKAASLLVSFLAGQKISDPQSGFRAMRGEKLEKLELRAERYAIEHIMILEAARKKFKIAEVPISCVYGEEKSGVRPVRDALKVAYHILRFLARRCV